MTRRGLPVTNFLALAGTGLLSLPLSGNPLLLRSSAEVSDPPASAASTPAKQSRSQPNAQIHGQAGSKPGANRTPSLGSLVPSPQKRSSGYFMLKGGGMLLSEEPLRRGVSLGLEMGGTVRELLDIGVSVDYFYGGSSRTAPVATLPGGGFPVSLVETVDESSAHLLPAGLTLRLRVPIPNDRFVPFVSGTVAYEWLFFHNVGQLPSDPLLHALQEESFTTVSWMGAAGLNLKVSPAFEVFGEAGLHHGSPAQTVLVNGAPVELKVLLDGVYARAGLRLGV
jgi:hypothetical protein